MSKKRIRLKPEEIELLSLKQKKYKDGLNPLYTLTNSEYEQVLVYRHKTKVRPNFEAIKIKKRNKEFDLSAWTPDGKIMSLQAFIDHHNLPKADLIHDYRLCTHTKVPTYNISWKKQIAVIKEDLTQEFIDSAIAKLVVPVELEKLPFGDPTEQKRFDRLIYTDVHIGMDTNKDGNALYPIEWNDNKLMYRLREMVKHTIKNKTSEMLVIDDLGDLMDGWDGQTVRKGHHLPQNMDNKKAFDVALQFKVRMIQLLIPHYDFIQCNNICEDNHSGAFGYIVNSAFKSFIEMQFPNVVYVTNHESFINHYTIFDRHFVISHGKDSKNLKFGFKPHLDPKQIEKIDQYMKHNKLYDGKEIEFSKGDSHQLLLDMSSSDDFDYFNYLAFSPSSEWVQTNFKKGRSGFVLQHYDYDKRSRSINPYFFND